MARILQSGWFCGVLGAVLYWSVTAYLLLGIKPPPRVHAVETEPADLTGPSWDFFNPEMDRMIEDLQREKSRLSQRAKDLQEWEQRLQAERVEINSITQTVHRLRTELDADLLRVQEEEMVSLKKLSRLFSGMETATAISLFDDMPNDEIVKYLSLMKDEDKIKLLEAMAKKGDAGKRRVGALTERLLQLIPPPPATP
jgi:hypothetical protein